MDTSSVKLISISAPQLEECNTAEEFIAYTARVSNPTNQANHETAARLLKYLIKNKHWSPFEMVSVTMEINTTRDIGRQILRHRSFSFQEFSQRYAESQTFTLREARLQDMKNRQNSISLDDINLKEEWQKRQKAVLDLAKENYLWALGNNIAKEQARAVLPEGLTGTRMYMSGTLRSWIHYCELRCSNGTQAEHREIALGALEELRKTFPNVILALEETLSGDKA